MWEKLSGRLLTNSVMEAGILHIFADNGTGNLVHIPYMMITAMKAMLINP